MSVNTQYLKSCFLSLIVTLVYILLGIKAFKIPESADHLSFFIVSIACVFISGLITPLAFVLKDKVVTDEVEDARPDDKPIDLPNTLKTAAPAQSRPQKVAQPQQHKTSLNFIPMPEDDSAVCDIFIGNIPFALNEFELKKLIFSATQNICSLKIPKDPKTKKRKNFAFVRVLKEDRDLFISKLNNREVKGRKLSVKEANSKTISA